MSDIKTEPIVSKIEGKVKKSSKIPIEKLLEIAKSLPTHPGCYLMLDTSGKVLYVGKAKNLKNRVMSYFNKSEKSPKTQILVSHIASFEFIITKTDAESFVLENNLIKEHRPKYNIRLKDDKSYPYLQVNFSDSFPRLEYVRRPTKKSKIELFGPFPVGSNISEMIKTVTKAFSLRDCSKHEFNSRKTPCLLYQMKQCSAPCVGKISETQYKNDLKMSVGFFQSKSSAKKTLQAIEEKMIHFAENEEFELAAMQRDYLLQLQGFSQSAYEQNVEFLNEDNIDVISYYLGESELDISLYLIRKGNLLGHKNFHFLIDDLIEVVEEEIVQVILQYYAGSQDLMPNKVITSLSKEASKNLEEALSLIEEKNIKVHHQSKKYQSLVDSTYKHAVESQRIRMKYQDSVYIGLNKLKDLLKLKDRPKTIECYDIAVWQGKSPTASQIVFYEGKPDKVQYRYYHLEERPEGNNDFAMMREVFERRLKKGSLPDVFLVDGGVQQVNTVQKVLDDFSMTIPVVGIAKARELKKYGFKASEVQHSDERLIIQGRSNPFILKKCPPLMKILVYMRDEAHRFSRKLHHKAESKRVITSWLDEVKGLDTKTKILIKNKNIYSLHELIKLEVKDLEEFFGINFKHAKIIYEYLHAKNSNLTHE